VAPYLRGIPRRALVYHCVDRWWAFNDYNTEVMQACHRELCEQADVTFASALALLEDCRAHTDRAELMPHGVEWAHFAQAALDPPPRPADIADLTGPIIGFFGLLHEWIDQDLLCRIAQAHREATLVLIGAAQVDVSRLQREPNIRLLGRRQYSELPAYSAAFDLALIPFVFSDLTVAVNPIKLREYLSAGLPVVASALPEIRALGDQEGLFAAENPDAFLQAVGAVLRQPVTPAERESRARAMASESWMGRCAQMAESLRARLR
jgi:glycosyltransferase involved in cell wall biosynthesis